MSLSSKAICPYCKKQSSNLIGKLPSSNWFAGQHIKEPLPGGGLYHCTTCHLKFRYPIQPQETYIQLYDNSSTTTWSSEILRQDWDMITDYIHSNFSHGGKVLDFGCYSGGLLAKLNSQYQKFGIEINKTSAAIAIEKNHARVWQHIEDIPESLSFDIIIAADVIEHIVNPAELIEQLMQRLTPNGVLIVTTGDADNYLWNFFGANWWYCFYPEHIVFISERWLKFFSREYQKQIIHIENFRYIQLSKVQVTFNWIVAILYGVAPKVFLCLGWLIKWFRHSNSGVAPKGVGLSRDHIFVVLRCGK